MRISILLFCLYLSSNVLSQELLCNVQVNASQIQTSDRKIFQTLQTSIYEFLNNTQWTKTQIQNEERIECTFLISITERVSNDEFKATYKFKVQDLFTELHISPQCLIIMIKISSLNI